MNTHLNTKRILIFLAFAFGIPWAATLAIYTSPTIKNNPIQAVSIANLFFIATPWLGNIAARLVTREGWGNFWLRPNFKRGWRFYLAVWLLPLVATIVGGAVFYLLFPGSFDTTLGALRKLVESNSALAAVNPWVILLSTTFNLLLISAPINMVVSMGEELGWRAYLLPKLIESITGMGFAGGKQTGASSEGLASASLDADGARKAALLTGLIHGVWHWPLILMSLSLTPGATFLTPLVYLVYTCSLSILLSWGTLRSGSVWPAAAGHGAANAFSALPTFLLLGPVIPLIGPDVTGLIGGIGFTLLALVLFFSRKAFAVEREASSLKMRAVAGVVNL